MFSKKNLCRGASALLCSSLVAGASLLLPNPVGAAGVDGTDAIINTVFEETHDTYHYAYATAVDSEGNVFQFEQTYDSELDTYIYQLTKTDQDGVQSVIPTNSPLTGGNAIAFDSEGNLHLIQNNQVMLLDEAGDLIPVAGDGSYGYDPADEGGPAVDASLRPIDIAFDDSGNLYIADYNNNRVRMVDTDGNITTVAGDGTTDYDPADEGMPATTSGLNRPRSVDVDLGGNIYVADYYNHRIRMIDTDGNITTVAGDGTTDYDPADEGMPATEISVPYPNGLEVDDAGNLYFQSNGNRIQAVNGAGISNTVAGTGFYPGNQLFFDEGDFALDVAIDAYGNRWTVADNGDIYLTWTNNNSEQIVKIHDDIVDPNVSIDRPDDELEVWANAPLTALFSCDDVDGSGVESCTATLNGEPIENGDAIDTSEAGEFALTVVGVDEVGNSDSVTNTITVKADDAAPAITIAAPIDGSTVTRGESVIADFTCDDGTEGTGTKTCKATVNGEAVANGEAIDTDTDGLKVMVVSSTDNAGNGSVELSIFNVKAPVVLAFADCDQTLTGVHAGSSGDSAAVARLYMAIFARQPDAGGHAYWLEQLGNGGSMTTVSENFAGSPEFAAAYGDLTDSEFVEALYGNVLCRESDAAGNAYWTAQIADGMDRGRMALVFSDTPEFKELTGTK